MAEINGFNFTFMARACPKCDGTSTRVEDSTIGHCLDCAAYWCLQCGYIFGTVVTEIQCPHLRICTQCSDEHGYLDRFEFICRVCPTCEQHHENGCGLENPFECDRQSQFLCPYDSYVSECPRIIEFLCGQI